MKLEFPSREFDDAVADVCHGSASEEQARALNALLRSDPAARDEYILRVELHARLASEPDLFVAAPQETSVDLPNVIPLSSAQLPRRRALGWVAALAACLALLAGGWWGWRVSQRDERKGATSNAVAMLSSAVDAQWSSPEEAPRLGAPIEPRWLRLKSGLAQVVFYSGARVVIEGPAELQIISPREASCRMGRLTSEVPPQARGFQIRTPQMKVTDLGTVFGLDVKARDGVARLQGQRGICRSHRQLETESSRRLGSSGRASAPAASHHCKRGGVRVAVRVAGKVRRRRIIALRSLARGQSPAERRPFPARAFRF